MKRKTITAVILMIISVLSCGTAQNIPNGLTQEEYQAALNQKIPAGNDGVPGKYPPDSPVARYGKLQVKGTNLCDEKGNPVQLCGVFIRALKEEHKYLNRGAFLTMVKDWKIDVIRVPFWPAQWYSEPSYIGSAYYEKMIDECVALCEESGIYCIIDWHILGDGNPFMHAKESREFFGKLARKYGAKKHVIYELCNEPNGPGVTWNDVVRPYAEFVIPVIRAAAPDSIIIVGTSTWSQDVDITARNPLTYGNILYAFHFYSGAHKEALRARVAAASKRIALFSTEWGNSNYDARGGPFKSESSLWLAMMRENKISWCHYALTDFPEEAAMLKPGAKANGGWTDSDLTPSGQFTVEYLKNR